MLSAAVRRSSRDLNVMKEKLIFSGKTFVTLGCFVACSCSCSCSSSCSCSCSGSWTLRSIPPFWYADFSKSSFSNSQLKYEEWAFSEFQSPSKHVTPSQHASVWVSVNVLLLFLLFPSSLLKVSPSSSLCDVHHLLSMPPAVWLLPLFHASIASLVTHHSSAYCAPLLLHPSIHPSLHAPYLPHKPSHWRLRHVYGSL